MDLSKALTLLREGKPVRRTDWTQGTRLETEEVDIVDHPLIIIRDISDDFAVYSATQADLFAEWEEYEE